MIRSRLASRRRGKAQARCASCNLCACAVRAPATTRLSAHRPFCTERSSGRALTHSAPPTASPRSAPMQTATLSRRANVKLMGMTLIDANAGKAFT